MIRDILVPAIKLFGRLIFGMAIAALGAEHLIWEHFGDPNLPLLRGAPFVPIIPFLPLTPGNHILMDVTGLVLLGAGVCMLLNYRVRVASILVGVLFLLCVLFLEAPRGLAAPLDVSLRTIFFETLAMGAAALILAGLHSSGPRNPAVSKLIGLGPILFAISSVVFGIDHFLVLKLIASLVPGWLPGHMFWAYLTGAGLIAAGVSIAIRWLDYWAGFWLGIMFLSWVLFLHAPRTLSALGRGNPDEWSSALIALAMCGGSWICAGHAASGRQPAKRPDVPGF